MAARADWQVSMTVGLREHLVNKMVQSIILINDCNNSIAVVPDQIVSKLRVVEQQVYDIASSRSEYYHMIAERIYNMQKFIMENKEQMRNAQEANESRDALEDQIDNIGNMIEQMFLSS